MSKVYINKGREGGPWIGAAIVHNDGSLELFGSFGFPFEEDVEKDGTLLKEMWEKSPEQQMQVGYVDAERAEIVVEPEATEELVQEAQNGKYLSKTRNLIPA